MAHYCLCLLQSGFAIHQVRPKPAGWNAIPVEELAGPIVREADLEAAAPGPGTASCLMMGMRSDMPSGVSSLTRILHEIAVTASETMSVRSYSMTCNQQGNGASSSR